MVRRCVERKTGTQYAIKVMPIRDEERIRITTRAFANLSRLHHAGIVSEKALLISERTDTAYVVLEWLPHKCLSHYLHKGLLGEA